jgi:major membrane immunogen (membrane-anchored lipoprotein)
MKKVYLFSILALSAAFIVSCKKDRVCECTVDGEAYKVTLNDATKRQAKDFCTSQTIDIGNGQSIKAVCELK